MYIKIGGSATQSHIDLRKDSVLHETLVEFNKATSNSDIQSRWTQALDNDSSYTQAGSEIIACRILQQDGWHLEGMDKHETLLVNSPSNTTHQVVVLHVDNSRDDKVQDEQKEILVSTINEIDSDYRLGIILRQPLTESYNWTDIGKPLSLWVRQPTTSIHSFAYFRNNNPDIWIEFGVTSSRYTKEKDVVHFFINNNQGHLEWENIYNQTLKSIEKLDSDLPCILCVVFSKNIDMTTNQVLRHLYGQITCVSGAQGNRKYTFDQSLVPGMFKSLLPENVKATLLIQPSEDPSTQPFSCFSMARPGNIQPEIPSPYFSSSDEQEFFWTTSS